KRILKSLCESAAGRRGRTPISASPPQLGTPTAPGDRNKGPRIGSKRPQQPTKNIPATPPHQHPPAPSQRFPHHPPHPPPPTSPPLPFPPPPPALPRRPPFTAPPPLPRAPRLSQYPSPSPRHMLLHKLLQLLL